MLFVSSVQSTYIQLAVIAAEVAIITLVKFRFILFFTLESEDSISLFF